MPRGFEEVKNKVSRLATTAIGGLAALTALLLLRGARSSTPSQSPELMVIHAEPRLDTPALSREGRGPRMLVVPLHSS
jgi:hypothetical protein